MDGAYEYVRDNYGINSEPTYAYEMRDGDCRFNPNDIAADDTGYVQIDTGDEEAIKLAVATLGPVSAAIDAGTALHSFRSVPFRSVLLSLTIAHQQTHNLQTEHLN